MKKKKRGTRDLGEELAAVTQAIESYPDSQKVLLEIIHEGSCHAVARIALKARDRTGTDLDAALEAAFERFLIDPIETDPRCTAKLAIVESFDDREVPAYGLYAKGLRHVQREPAYVEQRYVDTAVPVRARCAVALARSRDPETVNDLIELLIDPERGARVGAAQALGVIGVREAIPVLRFKALIGDSDMEVMMEVLASLLALDLTPTIKLMERFLAPEAPEAKREAAALALGQSRAEQAFPVLLDACRQNPSQAFEAVLFSSLAMLRRSEATEWLLGRIGHGEYPADHHALQALGPFCHDPTLAARVRDQVAVAMNNDARSSLQKLLKELLEA